VQVFGRDFKVNDNSAESVPLAIAMKKDGLSVEAIGKYTRLSKEEIEKL
jgi:hypothetical protein